MRRKSFSLQNTASMRQRSRYRRRSCRIGRFLLTRLEMTGVVPSSPEDGEEVVRIVAAISDQALEAGRVLDQFAGGLDVGGVAGRQPECDGPPEEVADRVDLGRPAAARDADRLGFRSPFPPCAERCAFT